MGVRKMGGGGGGGEMCSVPRGETFSNCNLLVRGKVQVYYIARGQWSNQRRICTYLIRFGICYNYRAIT